MMFPYPSAEGLHVGNMFAFTGSDTYGRFKRLQGHDVFEPIGYDAFGIHSENYAIKVGINPAELIPRNIENFRRQLVRIGGMFDWRHELSTTDPRYYKWTQWIFLQLLKAGKAYKKAAAVNWCPKDKTVLANEQVINGRCERCDSVVEQRTLEQWFFRISEYADRLLANLDDGTKMDWSDSTSTAQRNWLGPIGGRGDRVRGGRHGDHGVHHPPRHRVRGHVHGAGARAPAGGCAHHPAQKSAVEEYQRASASKDLVSRKVGDKGKSGVFTGGFAKNPATGKPIPVWIADYVLMEYGTGAIMAVPGHDERDFEFADEYRLPIVRVVGRALGRSSQRRQAPAGGGLHRQRARSHGQLRPLRRRLARRSQGRGDAWLEEIGAGRGVVQFRLHDWCISRQRYWGPPIPIIYCDEHGAVPVPEKDLPVVLPELENFQPDDSGVSPLARNEAWYYAPCPTCGKRGRRETDVSDTFLDSAWYFLRYPSTEFDDRPFDPVRTTHWLPVSTYIGGNEHAVLHLLYSRFITMVLHDLGHVDFEEPFRRFRAHGLIVKDGAKMSKSRGNVVVPDEYIARWGADTFRLYLMFLGPFQEGGDFREEGISGPRRFLDKVWALVGDSCHTTPEDEIRHEVLVKYHQTVKRVSEGMEELRFNTSIAALMELVNALRTDTCTHRSLVEALVIMLAPFAPHFAEECWERLGHSGSIFDARWPGWRRRPGGGGPGRGRGAGERQDPVEGAGGRRDADEETVVAAAMRDATVRRFAEGKSVRKRIHVPNRLLNLLVG